MFFLPLVFPLVGRIEKEPQTLDIRSSVASEMDLLNDCKSKPTYQE